MCKLLVCFVESDGAVGAVFEEVFFRFGLLLHTFVFTEAVASALHPGRLDGEDEVVVVLAVEVRHEALCCSLKTSEVLEVKAAEARWVGRS